MTDVEKIILENQVKIMKILDEIVNTVAPNRWGYCETDARDNVRKTCDFLHDDSLKGGISND